MCFKINWMIHLLREAHPPFDQGHAFFDPAKSHIGLDIQMEHAELGCAVQCRFKILHGLGKAHALHRQTGSPDRVTDRSDTIRIVAMGADTIEIAFDDQRNILFERPFKTVGMATLHRPKRLQDEKVLTGRATLPTRYHCHYCLVRITTSYVR